MPLEYESLVLNGKDSSEKRGSGGKKKVVSFLIRWEWWGLGKSLTSYTLKERRGRHRKKIRLILNVVPNAQCNSTQ